MEQLFFFQDNNKDKSQLWVTSNNSGLEWGMRLDSSKAKGEWESIHMAAQSNSLGWNVCWCGTRYTYTSYGHAAELDMPVSHCFYGWPFRSPTWDLNLASIQQ